MLAQTHELVAHQEEVGQRCLGQDAGQATYFALDSQYWQSLSFLRRVYWYGVKTYFP